MLYAVDLQSVVPNNDRHVKRPAFGLQRLSNPQTPIHFFSVGHIGGRTLIVSKKRKGVSDRRNQIAILHTDQVLLARQCLSSCRGVSISRGPWCSQNRGLQGNLLTCYCSLALILRCDRTSSCRRTRTICCSLRPKSACCVPEA